MFEDEPVIVNTEYVNPAEIAEQETESLRVVPTLATAGSPHVRVMAHEADITETIPVRYSFEWPTEYAVNEGNVVIGGVRMHAVEDSRAENQTANSQGLAIDGTVSNLGYRMKVEASRRAKAKRALIRILTYVGLRADDEPDDFELGLGVGTDSGELVENIAA